MKSSKLIFYRLINNKNIYFFLGLFFLVFSIAVDPRGLSTNNGFSYYGTFAKTLLPYLLSLLFISLFIYPGKTKYPYNLTKIFKLISIFYLLLIIFPYSWSKTFDYIHTSFGGSIFFLEFVATFLIYLYTKKKSFLYAFLMLFIFGLFSAYYIYAVSGFLLQFQVLYEITFMISYLNLLNFRKQKKSLK